MVAKSAQTPVKLLLTGGTGFFGKSLLRYWAALTAENKKVPSVTVLSRAPKAFLARHPEFASCNWLTFHQGDVLVPRSLPEGHEFTHVLHAATESTLGPMLTPLQRHTQIVDGTRNILNLVANGGKPRILLTSSGGVYGPIEQFERGVPEDYQGMPDPLHPQNAYGVAKRQAEHLCSLYSDEYGLEYIIARCFAFVGEDLPLDAHFAIGNFLRDALVGDEILVKGDGSPIRSYLHQRDLAQWLTEIMLRGAPQRAYNVGSDQAISIAELARKVAERNPGRRSVVRIMNQSERGSSASRNFYIPDITRARNELGLEVSISLDQAIDNFFRIRQPSSY